MSRSASTVSNSSDGPTWNVFSGSRRGSLVNTISRQTTVEDLAEHSSASPCFAKRTEDFMRSHGISGGGPVLKKRGEVTIALKATAIITSVVFFLCYASGVFNTLANTERIARAPPASFLQPNAAKQHFALWNYTELHGSMSFDIEKWITSSTRGDHVTTRHADIMDILNKSCDLFKRRFHLWLRAQPVAKGVRMNGYALQNKPALMKAPDMVKFRVLTAFINKSEPALHTKLREWMDHVRPKMDRFAEVGKMEKGETFELFSKAEWTEINNQMDQMKNDADDLVEVAKTLDPKAASVVNNIAQAFLYNYNDVLSEEGEMVIGWWPRSRNYVEECSELIANEHNLQKKRQMFLESKFMIKNKWEIGVESFIRTRLLEAFDLPEYYENMDATLGDTLKALRTHPALPRSIISRVEKMIHLQFMVIGSKLRFMTWQTLGSASGDIAF